MQKKLAIATARKYFPQLLQRPFRRRVFGDIKMYESSGSDLKGHEYIEDTEAGRDGHKEVTSNDSTSMVPKKSCPALIV